MGHQFQIGDHVVQLRAHGTRDDVVHAQLVARAGLRALDGGGAGICDFIESGSVARARRLANRRRQKSCGGFVWVDVWVVVQPGAGGCRRGQNLGAEIRKVGFY